MSEWKEGAPGEPEEENVQIPESTESAEDVQINTEPEMPEDNVQITEEPAGTEKNMQIPDETPPRPEEPIEPMPPETVEPIMPQPAYPNPPPVWGQPQPQPTQPGYTGQWQQAAAQQPSVQQPVYQAYPVYPTQQPVQHSPASAQQPPLSAQQPYFYAQPMYQPQQPQMQPQAYPPYPGAFPAQAPAKKKMSTGAKIFLIIAGILALAGIAAAVIYLVFAAGNSPSPDRNPFFGYSEPFDGYDDDDKPKAQEDEEPDFSIVPPEDEEEEDRPQVDVTPNTDGITISPRPSGSTMDAEAVYNRIVTSTVTVSAKLEQDGNTGESTGTGIIATSDGYIITNSHVVLNSRSARVTVTTYDGLEYEAVVVGVDRTTDLAVLKTNDHGFVPAEFGDADELSVGEWVLAIGNPGGARFSSSLTRGIISGLDREVGKYSDEGMTYIQTDAAINPGNSGGPLVNMYGQVVGINSSKIITEGYEGMGFAIPVSKAQPIINELLSGGYIKGRTRLGIMCREVGSAMSEMYNVPRGLQITEFNEDSTLIYTEAEPGDIIIAIEGETVESLRDVSNLLLRYSPGDQVTLTLYRPAQTFGQKGRELEVEITLLEDKGETQD